MASFNAGHTFVDGETDAAAVLNTLLGNATPQAGFITDRTAATPDSLDSVLIYDTSATALKRCTIAQFLATGGVVTSVDLAMPTDFNVAGLGTPTAPNFGITWIDQDTNKVLASPADGTAGTPTYRVLVPLDFSPSPINLPANVIDWSLSKTFWKQLTADRTFSFLNQTDGMKISVSIDHNGGFQASWSDGTLIWQTGVVPNPTDGLNLYEFTQINGAIYGVWLGTFS